MPKCPVYAGIYKCFVCSRGSVANQRVPTGLGCHTGTIRIPPPPPLLKNALVIAVICTLALLFKLKKKSRAPSELEFSEHALNWGTSRETLPLGVARRKTDPQCRRSTRTEDSLSKRAESRRMPFNPPSLLVSVGYGAASGFFNRTECGFC